MSDFSPAKFEHLKAELDEVYHAFAGLTLEQEHLRQTLLDANRDLEERVAHRTRELEEALREAHAANRAKSDFLAAMSHEIRTPMNGVLGIIDLLFNTQLDQKQSQMLRMAQDCSYALLKIIDEVLDFSKIEAGKIVLDSIPFELNHVVLSVAKLFQPKIDELGLRLSCFVDPNLHLELLGDRFRLRQVLTNLLGNAVKFTPPDQERPGHISIRVDRLSGPEEEAVKVRIQVSDNGIGMTADQLGKVFQKFTQADPSTTRRFGGTGLGLAICHGLVECMGGHIEASSTLGAGSCFSIYLQFERGALPVGRTHDLSEVLVLLLIRDEQLRQDVSLYAAFHKAQVRPMADPAELPSLLALEAARYIIVCEESDRAALVQHRTSVSSGRPLHYVVLSADRDRLFGPVDAETVLVENHPLSPTHFNEALAMAAGLLSTERDPASQELSPVIPEEALARAERASHLILVVEDNPHNHLVMSMQLEMLGYTAEFVENGSAALAASEAKAYSLILTDCHMPLMDGYELTRRIREREQGTGCHVPIVAVTANALLGEARHCLAVGMDDYLAKPVVLNKLDQILRRWLPGLSDQELAVSMAPGLMVAEARELDRYPVFEAKALDAYIGRDVKARRELLNKFAMKIPVQRAELQAASTAEDLGQVAELAHRFKSSTKCFGAHRMAEICLRLERSSRERDLMATALNMAQFAACSEQLEQELRAYLGS